jgi:hypothetical protein
MKKNTLLILGLIICVPVFLLAEEKTEQSEENQNLKISMGFDVGVEDAEMLDNNEMPHMGVYIADLTFQDAYEMHYPYNYGALLTGVVNGTNADRAGLIKNDIVVLWNSARVRSESHLLSLIKSHSIGDVIEIVYFRNEEELTTSMTFSSRNEKPKSADEEFEEEFGEKHKSGKLSPGFGGGFVNAKYIDFDYSELNQFISQFGFSELDPERTIYFGGGGMGNIGKGWFIGGLGYGFHHTEDINNPIEEGKRHLIIDNGFGGVTLTKKMPLFTEKLVLDFNLMLGGGIMSIEVGESNGFNWQNSIMTGKYQKFQKEYMTGEVSVGMLWRVKKWFGFHARYGLMQTFTLNDIWNENTFSTDTYSVEGIAPELPFGTTATVGVWFGF